MDEERETAQEEDSLRILMDACNSITQTALSCKTLGKESPLPQDVTTQIRMERELGQWLEAQILDYQVAIASCTKKSDIPDQNTVTLKERLLDETRRVQQEKLYIEGVALSRVGNEVMTGDVSSGTADADKKFLCREAIKARDEQVVLALEKAKKIRQLDQDWDQITMQQKQLLERSRRLWNNHIMAQSSLGSFSEASTELQKENRVLKRVLLDIIVGSRLWCSDERIKNTMMKLED